MDFSCGCLFDKRVKEPYFKKTKHFEDVSASFAINAKNEQLSAHYSWLVEMHKPVSSQQPYIEAKFQNPEDRSNPIVVPAVQLKNNEPSASFAHPRYYFLSPSLPSLDCGLYKMELTVYADKSKQKILTQHGNELLSRVNTDTCVKAEFIERMEAAARHTKNQWETQQ
ncbi:hypothetical protein BDF14DRAFT_1811929 [Spinellus fusiger]|nr:hypothetical protein BDF14DRAFT_1811929 [Spinellus fusiger]